MFQTLIIVGNLGKEPEMHFTPSGANVTTMSVATNRTWVNGAGEKQKETTWFKVSAWSKLAETCNQYLHKGSRVLIEGRLIPDASGNPRVWNGTDGTPHASFEINASLVRFMSPAGENNGGGEGEPLEGSQQTEDIPF
jgi:single-strand DNA-binding protein